MPVFVQGICMKFHPGVCVYVMENMDRVYSEAKGSLYPLFSPDGTGTWNYNVYIKSFLPIT